MMNDNLKVLNIWRYFEGKITNPELKFNIYKEEIKNQYRNFFINDNNKFFFKGYEEKITNTENNVAIDNELEEIFENLNDNEFKKYFYGLFDNDNLVGIFGKSIKNKNIINVKHLIFSLNSYWNKNIYKLIEYFRNTNSNSILIHFEFPNMKHHDVIFDIIKKYCCKNSILNVYDKSVVVFLRILNISDNKSNTIILKGYDYFYETEINYQTPIEIFVYEGFSKIKFKKPFVFSKKNIPKIKSIKIYDDEKYLIFEVFNEEKITEILNNCNEVVYNDNYIYLAEVNTPFIHNENNNIHSQNRFSKLLLHKKQNIPLINNKNSRFFKKNIPNFKPQKILNFPDKTEYGTIYLFKFYKNGDEIFKFGRTDNFNRRIKEHIYYLQIEREQLEILFNQKCYKNSNVYVETQINRKLNNCSELKIVENSREFFFGDEEIITNIVKHYFGELENINMFPENDIYMYDFSDN
jgi:hypothetical protein